MKNKYLFIYDIKQTFGNFFTPFFGIALPIIMTYIFGTSLIKGVPEDQVDIITVSVFLTNIQLVPLAVILIGFSATFSQELEKKTPTRMKLFNFSDSAIFGSKLFAQILILTVGLIIYISVCRLTFDYPSASDSAFLLLILFVYLEALGCILIAYAAANYFRKFGPTYFCTMILYFTIMIISGMMGLRRELLPDVVNTISEFMPFTHISHDFVEEWIDGTYNFGPLIQSFIIFISVGILLCVISIRSTKSKLH